MWRKSSGLVYRARYWRACREAEPLMGQSLYETLPPEDAAKRDALFASFPELEQEFESISRVSNRIELKTDDWSGDLLPGLAMKIEDLEHSRHHRKAYALAFSGLAVFSIMVYSVFMLGGETVHGPTYVQQAAPREESALSQISTEACDLVALGETERAAELLESAINTHPGDKHRADAILTLADIEYTYLQRYERAYEIFKRLEQEHRDVFEQSWATDKRMRMLTAAFPDAFEPLRELEAAAHCEDPLHGYENILVNYPDKIWSEEAMRQMSRLLARESGADPADTVQMLQRVRNACAHPVALERIDLELGNYYCDALDAPDLAQKHYAQAAASRHIALAAQAREALARLE